MALFGQDAPDPRVAHAGAVLGDLALGGPGTRAEAKYPQYLKQSADAYGALEKAGIARAQRVARDNLPAAIAGDAVLGSRADLASSILGMATGQPNLGSYTKALGDIGDIEIDRQIEDRLAAGDLAAAQRLSAVKTDKVLPTLAAGGKAVFTPLGGEVAMTPLGEADINATQALGSQRLASAAASNARAHKLVAPTPALSPVQKRAATLEEDIKIIEGELGRTLSTQERADFLQGKAVKTTTPTPALGDVAGKTIETDGKLSQARRAVNPKTGEIIELRNGQWVPAS